MSDYDDELDDEPEDDQTEESRSPLVNQLRGQLKAANREAKRAAELEAELASYKRQDVLKATGLDLDDQQRRALEAVHQGEWTPEAIKATAVALKWADPPAPDVPPEDFDTEQRIAGASTGANTVPNRDADIDARLASAKSEAEFDAIYRESGRMIVGMEPSSAHQR